MIHLPVISTVAWYVCWLKHAVVHHHYRQCHNYTHQHYNYASVTACIYIYLPIYIYISRNTINTRAIYLHKCIYLYDITWLTAYKSTISREPRSYAFILLRLGGTILFHAWPHGVQLSPSLELAFVARISRCCSVADLKIRIDF